MLAAAGRVVGVVVRGAKRDVPPSRDRHQLVVRPLLHNLRAAAADVFQDADPIRVLNRAQTVRDHDRRSVAAALGEERVERGLHELFGLVIESGRRLVEEEDLWVFNNQVSKRREGERKEGEGRMMSSAKWL